MAIFIKLKTKKKNKLTFFESEEANGAIPEHYKQMPFLILSHTPLQSHTAFLHLTLAQILVHDVRAL